MAESEEELKSLLMKVKEEREKAGFKLNIQETQWTQQDKPKEICTKIHQTSETHTHTKKKSWKMREKNTTLTIAGKEF